jgi:plastocyanin
MKRKNLSMYLLIAGTILILSVSLAGCASAGSSAVVAAKDTTAATTSAATTAAAASAVVKNEISIKANAFSPDNLSIKVGDTVTWVNNDSYSHTVKAVKGEFDSGDMASGAKFSFTFGKEGTYDYICGIHTFMTGKIVVTK